MPSQQGASEVHMQNTALPLFPGHQQAAWSLLKWSRITCLSSRWFLKAAPFWQWGAHRTYPTANLSAFAVRWNIALCYCIELKWQFSSARNSSSFFLSLKTHYTRTFNVGFAKSGSLMSLSRSSSVLSHNCHCNKHTEDTQQLSFRFTFTAFGYFAKGSRKLQEGEVISREHRISWVLSSPPVAAQMRPTPLSDIGFSFPMSWWSTAKRVGCPVNLRFELTITLPLRWAERGDIARLVNAHLPAGT